MDCVANPSATDNARLHSPCATWFNAVVSSRLLTELDAGFSLNHPNQYFTESLKLLGGGRDIKKEADSSQRSQENPANVTRPSQANTKQANEEMGDLDSFFQDE
ncbi:hypothetical protein M9458_026798 [Cirrhinus mrigala]|uniref:Uncharacterized protein n=1 Tax=Cirrhinus mrigala TaxID=683832 RepID=A0ABD0PV53_CIRMR